MNVVYIHQYFRTPRMAGGTRSYEFARRLVTQGHRVSIVTAESESPDTRGWRTSTEDGIDVHWVTVRYDNAMPPWRRLLAFGHFLLAASRRAAALPQDVVLATSTPLTVAIPGAWSAFRNRVPLVLEVRDLWPTVPIAMGALRAWPMRKLAIMLEKWAYARSSKVIALSPDMAAGIRAVDGRVPINVIPNAADRDLFGQPSAADEALLLEYPWAAKRPIVLYAGTFGRVNGVSYLVDMASRLAVVMPEVAVVLVGGGADFEATRLRAAELRVLDRNCFVLGRVPKETVAAWFRASAIATSTVIDVPELTANSANKFFDALAAGIPVAINHGGWLAEELESSGAGIVLPGGDPSAAADMVAQLLSDPERLMRAGRSAQRLAEDKFDRDRLAKHFEAVLVDAVAEARGVKRDAEGLGRR
ncbi:glycosyltransferase family 4 protein [Blastococcus sp. SYSU DS0510]